MLTADLSAAWLNEGASESFRQKYAEFVLAHQDIASGRHAVYSTDTHVAVSKERLGRMEAALQQIVTGEYDYDEMAKIAREALAPPIVATLAARKETGNA